MSHHYRHRGRRNKTFPKGLYEKLLCADCESIIEKYEDYAAKALVGSIELSKQENQNWLVYTGLDYAKFKLFQVSLLWRAGVATRPEFGAVDLGPHAEKLRRMLHCGNPGLAHQYGCIVTLIPEKHKRLKSMIYAPEALRQEYEGHHVYRAIFGGFLWVYVVSSHSKDFPYQKGFLSSDGTLRILKASPKALEFIRRMADDLVKTGKTPP